MPLTGAGAAGGGGKLAPGGAAAKIISGAGGCTGGAPGCGGIGRPTRVEAATIATGVGGRIAMGVSWPRTGGRGTRRMVPPSRSPTALPRGLIGSGCGGGDGMSMSRGRNAGFDDPEGWRCGVGDRGGRSTPTGSTTDTGSGGRGTTIPALGIGGGCRGNTGKGIVAISSSGGGGGGGMGRGVADVNVVPGVAWADDGSRTGGIGGAPGGGGGIGMPETFGRIDGTATGRGKGPVGLGGTAVDAGRGSAGMAAPQPRQNRYLPSVARPHREQETIGSSPPSSTP